MGDPPSDRRTRRKPGSSAKSMSATNFGNPQPAIPPSRASSVVTGRCSTNPRSWPDSSGSTRRAGPAVTTAAMLISP